MSTWVLLRGLTRERGHWGEFPQRLAAGLRAEVVALDLAGNGERHGERSPLTIGAMAADVDAQVQRVGLTPPVNVLALSLGAMVAIDWARIAAGRIERLVLVSTSVRPWVPLHWRLRPQSAATLLWQLLRGDPESMEDAVLRLTSARAERAILPHWLQLRAQHPVSRLNALRQLVAAARFRAPQAPAVPTLLLAGRRDRLVDVRSSERIAVAWRCPVRVHENAGHDLPLDASDWVIAQVGAWLAASAPPQS
jgi:pimeloyl-ACP methyl ester carboxylesterase